MERTVQVFQDADEVAARASEFIADAVTQAVAEKGRCFVALSGGSTPRAAYEKLGGRSDVPWDRLSVFLSDERFVPWDDPASNYGMIRTAMPDIPASSFHPVQTDRETAAGAAQEYERDLITAFGTAVGQVPEFDLVLLGLGEDGHTASLFPGAESLKVRDRCVVACPPGTLPPPVERVTFTLPLLSAARQVLFLVSGEKKAEIVRKVLSENSDLPAAQVHGCVTWMLDQAAVGVNGKW